ncbi:MAG: hypothetical protein DKT66_04445 [Candidatus Melainabacteria bacterium]|nr:MAG: hypothetical protein DKT66_04445 [Candidatus Melainabacteria bacterium]
MSLFGRIFVLDLATFGCEKRLGAGIKTGVFWFSFEPVLSASLCPPSLNEFDLIQPNSFSDSSEIQTAAQLKSGRLSYVFAIDSSPNRVDATRQDCAARKLKSKRIAASNSSG